MDAKKALSKCMQLCSTTEYAIFDIRQKLSKWEIFGEEQEQIIERLVDEKFLNEERFISAFVNDKFRFNRWGKTKIRYMLGQKGLGGSLVANALNQIDEDEYLNLIKEELEKKAAGVKAKDKHDKKVKVLRFLASRGFESDLIYALYERHVK